MENITLDPYKLSMIAVFIIGYFLITLEHITKINKATVALMMAIICWVLQFADVRFTGEENLAFLGIHVINISQVVFFLIGALTVVEIINVHKGFSIISNCINVKSKKTLLWVIGFLAFFLSAILDNLTTTIVMLSLVSKLVDESEDRLLIGGGIVIAANAGGAWTPIGDVTTTMLWIGGEITSFNTLRDLFLPSLACMIVSFLFLSFLLKGDFQEKRDINDKTKEPLGNVIFFLGIGLLVFVPIFKYLTGLPPFMGMLFGLSVLWLVTDIVHRGHANREHLYVPYVLSKIDLSATFFFLGILLCIDALETAQILHGLAIWFDEKLANPPLIATIIGLASAVIDNVPLVAASMGMYGMTQYPQDSEFWQLVAYCAGTGGSILIIGSAAGIVFMGLEKVDFYWYAKRIGFSALAGYLVGIAVYLFI